jgi:Flp pilus assembly protein TadG
VVGRRNRAFEGRWRTRRVTPRGVLAMSGEERGVVVPIVALSLIAIMGMLVLVIDVGGLLWARRQMVNGADAAALAAAQSCAKTNDTEDPEQMADDYAVPNASDVDTSGQNIIDEVNCDTGRTGYVTVRYSKDQPLFFGPVLGSGSSTTVPAEATAHWGGVGISDGVIPLVIYSGFLQGPACNVPDVQEGTVCYFWEDNDLSGQGNFGFLDVESGWNVARGDSCPNVGGDQILGDWINGTRQIGTLELNYPRATWVCTRAGNHSEPQVWNAVRLLRGETRVFPVVGTSPADNQPAQVGTPQPKYNAVGFAQMEIMDVLTVQNTAPLTCGPVDVSTLSSPLDLMGLCIGIPDNATFIGIPNGGVTPGNVNWSVTPEGVFSWTGTQPTSIRFTYSVPTTNCGGVPAPNASAHCLVLRWNGYSFDTKPVGGGGSFGMMAIALCDQRYNSCVQPGL